MMAGYVVCTNRTWPSARRQAEKTGARIARGFVAMHRSSHLGEVNRVRKRIASDAVDDMIRGLAHREWSFVRWRDAMRRGFRRTALGLLATREKTEEGDAKR